MFLKTGLKYFRKNNFGLNMYIINWNEQTVYFKSDLETG